VVHCRSGGALPVNHRKSITITFQAHISLSGAELLQRLCIPTGISGMLDNRDIARSPFAAPGYANCIGSVQTG
jgi:hypothetical protein